MVELIKNFMLIFFGMGIGAVITCVVQVGRVTGKYRMSVSLRSVSQKMGNLV